MILIKGKYKVPIVILLFILLFLIFINYDFKGTTTLYQLPNATNSQMMGYLIRTDAGKIIAIDGGTKGDTEQLYNLILKLGGKVDAWFITHPHYDHVEAMMEIINNYEGVNVLHIYASLCDEELADNYEPNYLMDVVKFNSFISQNKEIYTDLSVGDKYIIDNVIIDVLSVRNPEITVNYINNSSCSFKIYTKDISVLFLGDLGIEGGDKLLAQYKGKGVLKSDIVQMAHHGQSGVSYYVYEEISPKIALWPTPKWLWDNQPEGQEFNTGAWDTLNVRMWMENLGVRPVLGFESLKEITLARRILK